MIQLLPYYDLYYEISEKSPTCIGISGSLKTKVWNSGTSATVYTCSYSNSGVSTLNPPSFPERPIKTTDVKNSRYNIYIYIYTYIYIYVCVCVPFL